MVTAAEAGPALQVRGLRAGYDTGDILHGVDFDLRAGEVLGVVGPNGSGKSTLLRAVTGLLPLRSGTVEVGGEALGTLGQLHERREGCPAALPYYRRLREEYSRSGWAGVAENALSRCRGME